MFLLDKMTEKSSSNPLEQFVLLAKTAKGAAALELVKQALEAPGVYVFGELLDMPNVKEVSRNIKDEMHFFKKVRRYTTDEMHFFE